jgi:hypothetical protein
MRAARAHRAGGAPPPRAGVHRHHAAGRSGAQVRRLLHAGAVHARPAQRLPLHGPVPGPLPRRRRSFHPSGGAGMKRHLNTLYVTTQGAISPRRVRRWWCGRRGDAPFSPHPHPRRYRLLRQRLVQPVPAGAVRRAGRDRSPPHESGRFLARVDGRCRATFSCGASSTAGRDDPAGAARWPGTWWRPRSRTREAVLLRAGRDHASGWSRGGCAAASRCFACLAASPFGKRFAGRAAGDRRRGGGAYFEVFDHLITAQKEDFVFRARSRRPPLDPDQRAALLRLHAAGARLPLGARRRRAWTRRSASCIATGRGGRAWRST